MNNANPPSPGPPFTRPSHFHSPVTFDTFSQTATGNTPYDYQRLISIPTGLSKTDDDANQT